MRVRRTHTLAKTSLFGDYCLKMAIYSLLTQGCSCGHRENPHRQVIQVTVSQRELGGSAMRDRSEGLPERET